MEIPQNNFFLDEDESAPVDINHDSALFDADEYYNYNEILNPYFNRQFIQLTYEGITDSINSILSDEK